MDRGWTGIDELVAIAETGSFVGAARRLALSPSHVSRAIAQLEDRVGARLFERTTRQVRLTPAGSSVVERCRRLIDEREDTLRFLRSREEMEGAIRLTCSTALGERFVTALLLRFLAEYPRISVKVELSNRVVDIVGESFDVAIRTGHPADDRLAARQVAARELVAIAAPAYLERHGEPLHPDDLAAHACLVGTSTTWHFRDGAQKIVVAPSGRWTCNSGDTVVQAALAGLGVGHLPRYYVASHLEAGTLVEVLGRYREGPEPIWAVYPARRPLLAKVRALLDLLEQVLPGMMV
ncbi:LysR family transcriptional regulator [Novosphingobium flavum]|uniref:LysR family transcriptional regulator n=1 Tax=Novosphingobium flavum TaxID=1778672 RepID=A0A7X1KK17_9SPHN|nr:LysR family transcriptional regulator [Novosphingobium flavum]MBC2664061.1 LysR family transcriptional regulator [Novosphingobium flavum]